MKRAYLWGAERDLKMFFSGRNIIQRILIPDFQLNSFFMTEKVIKRFLDLVQYWKPDVIIGYAGSLYYVAKYIEKEGIELKTNCNIESSAETLYNWQREIIEKQFNSKVFNSYGSREVSAIAHDCSEHNGLHLCADCNITEIISDKENVEGKIIVTNLHNYAFPFIRYQIEDIGKPSQNTKCKCGRGLPLIENVLGRTTDMIKSPSGLILHGEYFTHLFYGYKEITYFQLIQESIQQLHIKYVKSHQLDSNILEKIKSNILRIDPNFIIEFEEVSNIPAASSGKRRFTISKIIEK